MKIFRIEFLLFLMLLLGTVIYNLYSSGKKALAPSSLEKPHLIILGIAQDAGYPQINCKKSCCTKLWNNLESRKHVSCIGIKDPKTKKAWLLDATPDIREQLNILTQDDYTLEGIFLTHAHMGHYTGLMELGREAMGADAVPVYVMPRMKSYLESNGPWSQLVTLNNIELRIMSQDQKIEISDNISVIPFTVPHRDEFSETVGYKISSDEKSCIFIPDIDKWSKWDRDIKKEITNVDYAFLDGTFYRNGEIWGRDMSQIPHPFIEESLSIFEDLNENQKGKIHFIHLNHTNPLLDNDSKESKDFYHKPYHLAREGQIFDL